MPGHLGRNLAQAHLKRSNEYSISLIIFRSQVLYLSNTIDLEPLLSVAVGSRACRRNIHQAVTSLQE